MTEHLDRINDVELERALALHRRRTKIVGALGTMDGADVTDVEFGSSRYDSQFLYRETTVSANRYGAAVLAAVRAEIEIELHDVESQLLALGVRLTPRSPA